jgi:hypothetical protein
VRVGVRVAVTVEAGSGSDKQNRARPLPDTLTTPHPSN